MKRFFVTVALMLTLLGAGFSQALAVEVEDGQRTDFTPPIMIVNTSFMNIRTGPGTEYPILLTVVGGTELPVLGSLGDGFWYEVSTIAGVGWVHSDFVIARGDFSNVPMVEAPEGPIFDPEAIYGDLTPGNAPQGESGSVAVSGGRQWGISITITHQAFGAATINSDPAGSVSENGNIIYPLLGSASGDGILWYQTSISELGTVWVEAQKSRLRPYACEMTAVVFAVPVSPTTGPDGSGSMDGEIQLNAGQEAYLLDSQNGMFKIELYDGSTGWIRQEDANVREDIASAYCAGGGTDSGSVAASDTVPGTSSDRPVGSTVTLRSPARAIINTAYLNIRSGPGMQYSLIATASGGDVYDITGWAPDGIWWRIYGDFGSGWVNSDYVIMRGNGTSIPVITDYPAADNYRPMATVTNAVTLYAAPNTGSALIGALSGAGEYTIVARTSDATWIQLDTPLGFGWTMTASVSVSGDLTSVPVAGG